MDVVKGIKVETPDDYVKYAEIVGKQAVELSMRFLPPDAAIESPEYINLIATLLLKMLLPAHTIIFNMKGNTNLIAERNANPQPEKVKKVLAIKRMRGRRPFFTRLPKEGVGSGSGGKATTSSEPHNGELSSVTTAAALPETIVSQSETVYKQPTHHDTTDNARGDERGQERPVGQGRGDIRDKDGDAGGPGQP